MRAAFIKDHPSFRLMRQTDVQTIYHMQMPRWLFSDPRYADMSLDAKVTYTFLLNRFQLSRRNGWVNDRGEVFVIYPRRELAKELRVCEQRITAAFRSLSELKLIWEKRCGRGEANQIYLAMVEPIIDLGYSSAPFLTERQLDISARTAEAEVLNDLELAVPSQELHDPQVKSSENRGSRSAENEVAEPQDLRSSHKEESHTERSPQNVSLSVNAAGLDGLADSAGELLDEILDACELDTFEPETAMVFETAIERLFYSDSYRIGNATLPQRRVRAKLRRLNGMILREAEQKLYANLDRPVRNSTAYTMATIFNCIAEIESDLMVDPYLNGLRTLPPEGG